jgi:hypothetical protein
VLGCSPSRDPSPLGSITYSYVEAVELHLGRMAIMVFVPVSDVDKGGKICCVQVSVGGMIK